MLRPELHVPQMSSQLGELILGIDHIAIAVTDIDAAIGWYTRALGFVLEGRHQVSGEHTSMIYAVLQAGESVIVLLQGTSAASQVSQFIAQFGSGVHHIAFAVADLDEAIARAGAAGSEPETPVASDTGIRQVFFPRDASTGVRVELVERRGGSFTEENVARLFRAMEEKGLC